MRYLGISAIMGLRGRLVMNLVVPHQTSSPLRVSPLTYNQWQLLMPVVEIQPSFHCPKALKHDESCFGSDSNMAAGLMPPSVSVGHGLPKNNSKEIQIFDIFVRFLISLSLETIFGGQLVQIDAESTATSDWTTTRDVGRNNIRSRSFWNGLIQSLSLSFQFRWRSGGVHFFRCIVQRFISPFLKIHGYASLLKTIQEGSMLTCTFCSRSAKISCASSSLVS